MPHRSKPAAKCSERPSPDKRETLKRIAEAAREAFAAKGLADARIDDIAQAAGVTKQLVYHYFRSKEELFACVLDESSATTMIDLVAIELDHLPPREALRAFLNHMISPYSDPMLSALAQEGIRYHENHITPRNSFTDLAPKLKQKMHSIIERGIRDGEFRSDVDPDLFLAAAVQATTSAYVSRYTVATLCGLDLNSKEDAEVWRRYSVDFVMAAIEAKRSDCHSLERPQPPEQRN